MEVKYIHTYIIGHYNPSVRIIDLVSHTTYVVCVNFIHKWRDLQFKVDSERQICLRNFSWQFYLLSNILTEICWEEIAEEILIVFCFDVWPGALTLAFRIIPTRPRRLQTSTKTVFFFTLRTNFWITQTFLTRFPRFKSWRKGKIWTFKMVYIYIYILFVLIC